jgi:hypothetical protein
MATEARRLPIRMAHHTMAPSIDWPRAATTAKKNISKAAKRITKAMNRAGSRSLTAMTLAATTPNATKAHTWRIV